MIDARLLRLVEASIQKIDGDSSLRQRLSQNLSRWPNLRLRAKWERQLERPWLELRSHLLAETEAGAALRQEAPLAGILTVAERGRIMREFSHDARPA